LLTKEGQLITYVQGNSGLASLNIVDNEDYDIDYYVDEISSVAARRLAIYGQLRDKLQEFCRCLRVEEEEHLRITVAKAGKKGFAPHV